MPSMFHLKREVKARPRPGPQSPVPSPKTQVAIAIYSPGPGADCHSADIGVEVQGGSLAAIKHTGHLLSIGSSQHGMIC